MVEVDFSDGAGKGAKVFFGSEGEGVTTSVVAMESVGVGLGRLSVRSIYMKLECSVIHTARQPNVPERTS